MRTRIKYHVIFRHRDQYAISVMCRFFQVSRSGYYDFVHRLGRPQKDAELAEMLCRHQERCYGTYGYRRMWLWLEQQNIHHNPKTVLRIMKKYNLLAQIRRRRKWKQMGEQRHSAQYSFSYIGAFFVRTIWGSTFAAEILAKKPDIF